jgi:hydroxymethylglutaryl-CoA synthase
VAQEDLEQFDGASKGKYTVGLGQTAMAVCGDREDINSVCLTAVHNLLEKYNIAPSAVGRLEVGTETIVDKSKAVKTTLMRLFEAHGNTELEGIDNKNACYGGTAALLNSVAWMESSAWDGRYAVVVAGDIAVYEKGPARPTGGAGVVAMLIGPKAPLVFERGLRATHMEDVYDFYKPTLTSEYPRVDGHLSNDCYLRSIDVCYNKYADRFAKQHGAPFSLNNVDYAVFHAPYNKLVQKSFGRYLFHDYQRNPAQHPELAAEFARFSKLSAAESYTNKDFLKALGDASKGHYTRLVQPSELITKQCGNSYCGSLYAGLLSLITNKADELTVGKRALLFSYGSGLAATLFSLQVKGDVTRIRDVANVAARLKARQRVSAQEFTDILAVRERTHHLFDHTPTEPVSTVAKGTYYLANVDLAERRHYARAFSTLAHPAAAVAAVASPAVRAAVAAPRFAPRTLALFGTALRVARRL